jgi:hypothetical protein
MPRSRTNPQFNQQSLPEALAPWQIGYEHIAELGGLRGKSRDAEPSPNTYWRVRSFRNYADYALTAPFAAGLTRLRERGGEHRCAMMCAEAVWWRCHRRIITDRLLAAGEQVMHILGKSHVDVASLTPGAVVRNDGTVVYPAVAKLPRPEPDQGQDLHSGPNRRICGISIRTGSAAKFQNQSGQRTLRRPFPTQIIDATFSSPMMRASVRTSCF